MIGRTHGVHAEPITFGLKLAAVVRELGATAERLRAAREAISVRQALRRGRHLRQPPPRGRGGRLRRAGTGGRAGRHPGASQRDRHAQLMCALASSPRRSRTSPPRSAHLQRPRCGRLEEPFGERPEGLLGHAPQAQPGALRARLRPGPRRAGQRHGGAGERRPVARARHQPLLGGAHHPARQPSSPWTTCCARFTGDRAGLAVHPSACAEPRRPRAGSCYSRRVLLALVERGLAPRGRPTGWSSAHAMDAPGAARADFRARCWPTRDVQGALAADELRAVFRPRAPPAPTSTWPSGRRAAGVAARATGHADGNAAPLGSPRDRSADGLVQPPSRAAALRPGQGARPVRRRRERLLIVATDRISAFDVVMPTPIPDKGNVLSQLSAFWFGRTADIVPNHLIVSLIDVAGTTRQTSRRTARCSPTACWCAARRIDVECVARGYSPGRRWSEYRRRARPAATRLPAGLRETDALPEPIFTPAIKAPSGPRQNIPDSRLVDLVGRGARRPLAGDHPGPLQPRRATPASGGSSSPTRRWSSGSSRRARRARRRCRRAPAQRPGRGHRRPAAGRRAGHARIRRASAERADLRPGGAPAELRQAVRARLPGDHRLGTRSPRRRQLPAAVVSQTRAPLRRGAMQRMTGQGLV